MKAGQATGLQIAFLVYAVMLLAVPLANHVVMWAALEGTARALVEKGTHFALAASLILVFPSLRRFTIRALAAPIPRDMRQEVMLVAVAELSLAFATTAALALWFWTTAGPDRVDRMIVNVDREVVNAFSGPGLARTFLAVLVGPVVEEIVFRGFIYRAFQRQWGWVASMLATSALFGLYHAHAWSAFAAAIIYTCLLRRTGSLWAPILVHMFFNLMLWWPLLGQHVFPYGVPLSDPATWRFHFLCLAFLVVALPVYVWMSRDRDVVAPTVMLEPHAAVPK